MGLFDNLFGKVSATRNNKKVENLKEAAEEIILDRRIKCVFLAREQGLSKEEMLEKYLDASLGSIDVFIYLDEKIYRQDG